MTLASSSLLSNDFKSQRGRISRKSTPNHTSDSNTQGSRNQTLTVQYQLNAFLQSTTTIKIRSTASWLTKVGKQFVDHSFRQDPHATRWPLHHGSHKRRPLWLQEALTCGQDQAMCCPPNGKSSRRTVFTIWSKVTPQSWVMFLGSMRRNTNRTMC